MTYKRMRGVAVKDPSGWILFARGKYGLDIHNVASWPDAWPMTVSSEFVKDEGWSVFVGSATEFKAQFIERSNRSALRDEIAELIAAKYRLQGELKSIGTRISKAEAVLKKCEQSMYDLRLIGGFNYPTPPIPENPVLLGESHLIPDSSGCYFAWNGTKVVYVGKSENLRNRLMPSHHAIDSKDLITWVLIPADELYFAEAFYIGTMRPRRNKAKPVIPCQ